MPTDCRRLLLAAALPLLIFGYTANLGFYSPPAIGLVLVATTLILSAALGSPRLVFVPRHAAPLLGYGPVALLILILLRQAMVTTSGVLAMLYALLATVGLVTALLAYLAGRRPDEPLRAALIGFGILLAGQAALTSQLRYPDPAHVGAMLGILACAVLACLVWLSFLAQPRPGRGWSVRFGLLLALGLGGRGLAIVGSPDPIIDVNAWLQQAPRFLLAGRNPYATDYPSPYGTERARAAGINDAPDPRPATYPPLAILTGVPAVLLGVDVRWVNVLADVLAAALLFLAGRARWRPASADDDGLALLAAGIYLCLPRTPFMIEQAWFEPQLAALAGALLLWGDRRPRLAGVLFGLLLAGKQLALALVPVIVRAFWARRQMLLLAVGLAALLALPFVLWSPGDFWQIVVGKHLVRPVIPHALTLLALGKQALGLDLPPVLGWGFALVCLAWLTWRGPRRWEPAAGLWLGASLLVFILGHKQGYFNYYVLATYLLLWGLLAAEPVPPGGEHASAE